MSLSPKTTSKSKLVLLHLSLLFFFLVISLTHSRTLSSDPCDPTAQRHPRTLRRDRLTVLLNGYSERRIPLLRSIAAAYSSSPIVASVLVLWGNPSTAARTLADLASNLTLFSPGSAPVSLLPQRTRSLNARFLPRPEISTAAVLVCDDDVEVDERSLAFAFRVWGSGNNRGRLVGIFARSHDLDLSRREWIYTVHHDKYSIVLTKFMILRTEYLYEYRCGGGDGMARARRVVDAARNCEDILMNFVAAEAGRAGPVLVGAHRARDWGDARNDDEDEDDDGGLGSGGGAVAKVGLSSRRREHRKRRGDCIKEFHREIGRMSLRYSYGKVVDSVGEQGLCRKQGKLVFCDHS